MEDIADRYRRLAGAFAAKIAAVPADRWDCPLPVRGLDGARRRPPRDRDAGDVLRLRRPGLGAGAVGRRRPGRRVRRHAAAGAGGAGRPGGRRRTEFDGHVRAARRSPGRSTASSASTCSCTAGTWPRAAGLDDADGPGATSSALDEAPQALRRRDARARRLRRGRRAAARRRPPGPRPRLPRPPRLALWRSRRYGRATLAPGTRSGRSGSASAARDHVEDLVADELVAVEQRVAERLDDVAVGLQDPAGLGLGVVRGSARRRGGPPRRRAPWPRGCRRRRTAAASKLTSEPPMPRSRPSGRPPWWPPGGRRSGRCRPRRTPAPRRPCRPWRSG